MVLYLCFITVACYDEEGNSPTTPPTDDPIQTTEAISKMVGRLEIRIDPRIELINIVENAQSFEEKPHPKPSIQRKTSNYFALYKEHPAVEMMQELKARGFTYTKPGWFILGYTNPPELRQLHPFKQIYPYSDESWIPDEETLAELIQKLKDFYNDSKFGTFYHEHRADYEESLHSIAVNFEKRDYVKLIEDYFGERKDNYVLIYSPINPGGFGIWIEAEGKISVYCIIGLAAGYIPFVLHEFGHTFVNPITDEYREKIDKYQDLFPPIRPNLPSSYDRWWIVVNEHIIRAFTARVETMLDGEEAGERALQRELSDGFKYIIPMYERLKEYETNRDKYPDFRSFYPRTIELFAELSSEKP
jgi:hypothetical protein